MSVNCVLWSCDMNSTLGPVVPLAMFHCTINQIFWPADMLIKRISFKAHWTKERDGGILIVEHILPVDDPHTCHTVIWSHSYLVTQLYGHTVIWSQTQLYGRRAPPSHWWSILPYFYHSHTVTQLWRYRALPSLWNSIFLYGMWQCSMVTHGHIFVVTHLYGPFPWLST